MHAAAKLCLLIVAWFATIPVAFAECPSGTYQVGQRREESRSGNVVTITVRPVCRRYVASGSALVGGVTWNIGAYTPDGASPELIARMRHLVHEQAVAAGIAYDAAIDFERYNFVLGIAKSTDAFEDVFARAALDEVSSGQFSAEHQALYASLRGRHFDELGCHSNGAMICLAAIMNRDVEVRNVVLYGPQLTPDTIYLWDRLVREGRIGSIRVLINENDPVTPTALLASHPMGAAAAIAAPFLSGPLFFNQNFTANLVRAVGPSLHVETLQCSGSNVPSLVCHDLSLYRSNRGCIPEITEGTVPGTNAFDRGGVAEPPRPC